MYLLGNVSLVKETNKLFFMIVVKSSCVFYLKALYLNKWAKKQQIVQLEIIFMAKLQKEFSKFHDEIKLGTYDENKTLQDKRDLLIDDLKEKLSDEKVPGTQKKLTFTKFDQGSYAMNTGIKPKDEEYDIDVGIIFNVTNDEYDSHKLKKLVRDKLNKTSMRTVEFNRPCVTVKYSEGYHVDLAIYSKNNDDLHIAWGKEFSKEKIWYKSEPKKLTKWVSEVSDDSTKCEQFRRCVRYLKKWKERKFDSSGNATPPSIGITIQARHAFVYKEANDLNALISIVNTMLSGFEDKYDDNWDVLKVVAVELPVAPEKDVYYKMTDCQLNSFHEKLETLLEALKAARDCESEKEASKILRKVFGEEFPEAEDIKTSNIKPVVPTGFNA